MQLACSQCGCEQTGSGWFLVWTERGGDRLCATTWESDPYLVHEKEVYLVCGQTCVTVALSKWMSKRFAMKVSA